ncbi:MAG: sigma 54-interacting transcriptional regulator [Deltaproteobacteria bacterium]|nr:sigma 54-interacting transcriptional regulator [Deltaproteobacteria bacterium]
MLPDRRKLRLAWEEFVNTGKVKGGIIRDDILASWRRCRSYGLDPFTDCIITDISEDAKEKAFAENNNLIITARPFLRSLYNLIRSLEMVTFLTDRDGFILEVLGEGPILKYAQSKNAVVGSSFNERYAGTTAVGMAIIMDRPYQMMAEEHYLEMIHVATCAAAPIHDDSGNVIGCLDITARYEVGLKHPHTLGMIVAAAQVIENQLKLKEESERFLLTSEYLKAAMETMSSGLIILNKDNLITHINPEAERILGLDLSTVSNNRIDEVISNKTVLSSLANNTELHAYETILQQSRCLVDLKPIFDPRGERMGSVLHLQEVKAVHKLVQRVVGMQSQYTFQDILGKSKEIEDVVKLGKAAAETLSNVLIVGESGVGKEILAQAIHNASPCTKGPFFAINCAAIPRDLIESELFGYEAGTFTGGVRGGKPGKLELAEGGTLFLDEVESMSLDVQAKLLRVLEEKKFLRLGGAKYLYLNARIIAATNKDLVKEIKKGNFRQDLYYRLNVLRIYIPPLRERREDIECLIQRFIPEISKKLGKEIKGITDEAYEYLKNRYWPGNVRELKNWIERAINLSQGPLLKMTDFPVEDALESDLVLTTHTEGPKQDISALHQIEMETIRRTLELCKGNISKASRNLGISRATLYRKMERYNISLSTYVS